MPPGIARLSPIDPRPEDSERLEDAAGLCLSGGGYRAMLFHAGAVYRLNALGALKTLQRISGVSGGSMTTAALAACWNDLIFDASGRATNLDAMFLTPLLQQARASVDVSAAVTGALPFSSAAQAAARSYNRNFCRGLTLADLPRTPVFVFNATSLMTGNAVRFLHNYVADHDVGVIEGITVKLADAVAASAAFPPFLSPAEVKFGDGTLRPGTEGPAGKPPYTKRAVVSDGGIYDNMGTETVWKRCRTIFVSNAGSPFDFDPSPKFNWLQQSLRVVGLMMNSADDMRERVLAHAYEVGARKGAMWGLTTGLNHPKDRPPLLSPAEYEAVQKIPTRLTEFSKKDQALLLKAGYAHATARLRSKFGPANGGVADQPDGHWPEP
jgi:NTE family protein